MRQLAWAMAVVLAGLSAIHVYWAAGGRRGLGVAVPEVDGAPLFRPGVPITLLVAALLSGAALLVLDRAGAALHLFPALMAEWGTWIVAVVFVARSIGDFRHMGFFKRQRQTGFARWDTRFYSPLALALGVGAAAVAISAG